MTRRNLLILIGIVLLVLLVVFVVRQIEQLRERDREIREALRIGAERLHKLTPNTWLMDSGPNLDWKVKLDGEVTTLVVTVSNRSSNLYKDMTFDGLTLGGVGPREKATLPVKVAEIAPGKSQQFELHYDHLLWLGDDVPADRIDTGWAQKPLDLSNTWVMVPDAKPAGNDPNVTVTVSEGKGSSNTKGAPIGLDEKDARALKAQRDAAWKAKSKRP